MIKIIYISITGNVKNFVINLKKYANKLNRNNKNPIKIVAKEVSDQTIPEKETIPYYVIVPTYLDGNTEIMTNALFEYINSYNNWKKCLGIIGSGNLNFGNYYCGTAQLYANKLHVPLINEFELRGNNKDIEKTYNILKRGLLNNQNIKHNN